MKAENRSKSGVRISCLMKAQVKPARDNHYETSNHFRPSKLSRIPCHYAVLRTIIFLDWTNLGTIYTG